MKLLRVEGYCPQKVDGGIVVKAGGAGYHIQYDNSRFKIFAIWSYQENDIELMRAIASYINDKMWVVKVSVLNDDKTSPDSDISVVISVEALISFEVELQEQLPLFIQIIEESAAHFDKTLKEAYKRQADEKEDYTARRSGIYMPEYEWLTEMVDAVRDGKLNSAALSDEAWLKQGFLRWCEPSIAKLWDEFKILRVDKYGDYKLIVYQFPEPKFIPEALYGAVLLNTSTNEASYYTLEYSYNGKWVLGETSNKRHINYGDISTNELEKFVDWIFNANKQVHHYTYLDRQDNEIVS